MTRGRYDEFVRAAARRCGHGRRAGDDRRHGRRRARRHRRLYRRPAQGAGRRARRSEVCRADRAGVAARGDRRSRRARSPRADGRAIAIGLIRSRRREPSMHRTAAIAQIRYNAAAQPATMTRARRNDALHVAVRRAAVRRHARARRSFVTTPTTTSACSAAAGLNEVRVEDVRARRCHDRSSGPSTLVYVRLHRHHSGS